VRPPRAGGREDEDEEVLLGDRRRSGGKIIGEDDEEEEDESSADEQADRDMQLLQEACLPVSGAPMPPSEGPPQTADEYLRQVQWERLHVPEIVDVEVEDLPGKRRSNKKRGVGGGLLARLNASEAHESDQVQFCSEWAEDVAVAFGEVRARCAEAREGVPQSEQERLTFAVWRELRAKGRPSTSQLARQNFVSINRLISVVVEALVQAADAPSAPPPSAKEEEEEEEEEEKAAQPAASNAGRAPLVADARRLDCLVEWIFAALSFLELPLVDDIQFELQQLRRTCHKLLSAARDSAVEGDASRDAALARVSLLLVIVTQVFGQR